MQRAARTRGGSCCRDMAVCASHGIERAAVRVHPVRSAAHVAVVQEQSTGCPSLPACLPARCCRGSPARVTRVAVLPRELSLLVLAIGRPTATPLPPAACDEGLNVIFVPRVSCVMGSVASKQAEPKYGLSQAGTDAIGYTGGGVLSICLIPQIAKCIITRCVPQCGRGKGAQPLGKPRKSDSARCAPPLQLCRRHQLWLEHFVLHRYCSELDISRTHRRPRRLDPCCRRGEQRTSVHALTAAHTMHPW